jgi:hypothetical protein
MKFALLISLAILPIHLFSQVAITIDASVSTTPVSRYIYGRNNSLSGNPGSNFVPNWTQLKDAGVTMFRESGGNNATKHNWRKEISSHPDWYNNVYTDNWSFAASSLQANIPSAQGMWAFQLIGKAAKTDAANFNDWGFNNSQWWNGVNQNLAGGGKSNPTTWASVTNPANASTKAAQEGDITQYLEDWTADSTTLILDHWFNKLGLNKDHFQYWNMDNEVEIWNGTHDDVMPTQLSAENFMQLYFNVAKKARAKYPNIKIVGPVTANEWQWYNWSGGITSGGKSYPWLEYFIKRVGEEQAASGVRLLDVLDIHFYPGSSNAADVVQYHRVFFDKNYVFPEANGVKNISGSWDNSQTKEYIFERCKSWLTQYMGASHNVTLGVTETGIPQINASTTAVWYASTLGEFMKHPEVEIFTPWTWNVGMWEVLHLFSRYNKNQFVSATSADEESVSAYPTINAAGDSLTVMLVNRAVSSSKSVSLDVKGFTMDNGSIPVLKLSGLSSTETFASHQTNALQKSTIEKTGNKINMTLPSLSVVAIQLKGQKGQVVTAIENPEGSLFEVFPNPVSPSERLTLQVNESGMSTIELMDVTGRIVKHVYEGEITAPFSKNIETSNLSRGMYFIRLHLDGKILVRKILVN